MQEAIAETGRRRAVQQEFNRVHNITPTSISKSIAERIGPADEEVGVLEHASASEMRKQMILLEEKMRIAAEGLDFERAIELRDKIRQLREKQEEKGGKTALEKGAKKGQKEAGRKKRSKNDD